MAGSGDIFFQTGTTAFFLIQCMDNYELDNKTARITLLIGFVGGTAYQRFFTRILNFWRKFDTSKSTLPEVSSNQFSEENILEKTILRIANVIGTARACSLVFHGYLASHVLFQTIGLKNKLPLYTLCIYTAISNAITFQAYNIQEGIKNTKKFLLLLKSNSNEIPHNENKKNNLIFFFAVMVGFLGVTAFSARSYFATKESFFVIPGAEKSPAVLMETVSIITAFASMYTYLSAKGFAFFEFLNQGRKELFSNIQDEKKYMLFPHVIFGSLYLIAMSLGYYFSCVAINEQIGASNSPYWNFLYAAFAMSGTLLEFSFNVMPMINDLKTKRKVGVAFAFDASREAAQNPITDDASVRTPLLQNTTTTSINVTC